jgi:DNA-binding MarR family transcriptional regulator
MKSEDRFRPLPVESHELGHEARTHSDDHAALKLWLRMLSCTTQIETEIRRRLRARFGVSLARFDYMAQLYRKSEGLKMRDLSRRLMVTGGNVTGLTDELERDGLVAREASPNDRRSWIVRLTPEGRRIFSAMAAEHERWIIELLGAVDDKDMRQLHAALGRVRVRLLNDVPSTQEK